MNDQSQQAGFGDTVERPAVPADDAVEQDPAYAPPRRAGTRRAERTGRRWPGCLAVLIALAILVGGLWLGVTKGIDAVSDKLGGGGTSDYSGQDAGGEVQFEVHKGDTAAQIGRNLKSAGVVASVDAFIEAATANPDSAGIQVGFYLMQKRMKAEDALTVLLDPANIVTTSVTIPEGLRVVDIVELLAKGTSFSKADFEAALDKPAQLGLPDYASGPEGYLFPATYAFAPTDKPVDMLKKMVGRWRQAAKENDLEARAAELGYTAAEMMTIASLVEAEGRGEDMPKIARVIYNRLEGPGDRQGTNGRLQIDATVNYALGRKGVATVTTDELETTDSPYNTYLNAGLPPGPIEAPGDAAIQAATHPAEGDWYYYVTVNLKTGETKFAETYDEFLTYKSELQDYCENESAGAC